MKHHSSRLGRKEGIAGLLLVTPQIIYFLVFFLLPLGICVYAGFTNWNILSPLRKFVGLRNFDKLFSDPKFWTACKNTLYYLIPIPFYLTFALAFAYSCHKKILGEKVFRVLYYLPFISSIVALTLIWKWLFNAKYGLVNLFLGLFGIAGPDWLGDPVWTRRMIVIMISWKMIGIISIYYIAALKNVPSTYYEAAKIDGANKWQTLWKVTIPNVMPSITICMFLTLTNGFKLFDQNLALTGGQPYIINPDGTSVHTTEMLALNIYNTFYGQNTNARGTAQAKAVLFFILVAAIGLIQLNATRKKEVQQ